MSTIRIQNLTKRYGPVLAVDDLSFDVRPGELVEGPVCGGRGGRAAGGAAAPADVAVAAGG